MFYFLRAGRELPAFLSSSAFLLGLLATTLAGCYPVWLRSTIDPAYNLTTTNSAANHDALQIALGWWTVGILLAGGYFAFVFHFNRGKVDVQPEGH